MKMVKKVIFSPFFSQNYGLMCEWMGLKTLLIYLPYVKGILVPNDALIVPNFDH